MCYTSICMYVLILQQLLWEAFADFFYFPIWWYTRGALRSAQWCFGLLEWGNLELALGVWLRNIFVPMYGQYDWQGRIISFVMRVVQIIFRGWLLLIWLMVCVLLFFVWLVLPIAVAYGFIMSLSAH